jgi:hypothetical protein
MRLRDFIIRPRDSWETIRRELDTHLREVRAILNGGFAVRDQLRIVRDAVIDTAALPLSLEVPDANRAIGVVLLRATPVMATGRVISGGDVQWDSQQAGTIRIHACSALAASMRYNATFAVVE